MADFVPSLIAQRAVMGSQPQQQLQEQEFPQYHQPFQERSIPGAIIGALLAGNPIGRSLMENINAYQNREVGPAMQAEAERQFREIGTPAANQAADMLAQNPLAFTQRAEMYGGPEQWYNALSSQAVAQSDTTLLQQWLATTPEKKRTKEELANFATAVGSSPDRLIKMADLFGAFPKEQGPLVQVYDPDSPSGTRWVTREEAIGQPGRAPAGMLIQTPEGLIIRTNVPSTELTPTQKTKTQQLIFESSAALGKLSELEKSFSPELLESPTRAKNWFSSVYARVFDLPDWAADSVAKQATFDELVHHVINKIVHDFGGANLTKLEREQIYKEIPSLEDDKYTFAAKMKRYKINIASIIARARLYEKNPNMAGLEGVPLVDIRSYIKQKAQGYLDEMLEKDPSMDKHEAARQVNERIGSEFGVYLQHLGIGG